MVKFLDKEKLSKWIQGEIDNLKSFVCIIEIEPIIKNLPKKKKRLDNFTGEFYWTFIERINTSSLQFLPENRNRRNNLKLILWATITLLPKSNKDIITQE